MNEVDYCKKCGGFIEWSTSVQLLTYPPKYMGTCKECGATHYARCSDVHESQNSVN
jgi:uncharacterized Zn finger protein